MSVSLSQKNSIAIQSSLSLVHIMAPPHGLFQPWKLSQVFQRSQDGEMFDFLSFVSSFSLPLLFPSTQKTPPK